MKYKYVISPFENLSKASKMCPKARILDFRMQGYIIKVYHTIIAKIYSVRSKAELDLN